jgi:hypothetical protein
MKLILVGILLFLKVHADQFPSILPSEHVEAYVKPELKRFRLTGDFLAKKDSMLSSISAMKKTIAPFLTAYDFLSNEVELVLKTLEDILTGIKLVFKLLPQAIKNDESLATVKQLPELKTIQLIPIASMFTDHNNELKTLQLELNSRGKREIITYKLFVSVIMTGGILDKNARIGCSLNSGTPKHRLACMIKFLRILKKPAMSFIGSDLILTLLKWTKLKNHPFKSKLKEIVDVLGLDDVSITGFKQIMFQRLMDGPTMLQVEVYEDLGIPDQEESATRESLLGTVQDLDEDEFIAGASLDKVSTPIRQNWDNWRDVASEIDESFAETTLSPPPPDAELNLQIEKLADKLKESSLVQETTERLISKQIMSDQPAAITEKSASSPADTDLSEGTQKVTEKSVAIEKSTEKSPMIEEVVFSQAKIFSKAIEITNNLSIQNLFKNLIDSLSSINVELTNMVELLQQQDLNILLEKYVDIKLLEYVKILYIPETTEIQLVVNEYQMKKKLAKYTRIPLCGYSSCVEIETEEILSDDSLELKEIYATENCHMANNKVDKTSEYFCSTAYIKENCTFVRNECNYLLRSYAFKSAQLYLDKYLVIHTNWNGSIVNKQIKLPADSIVLLTVKEKGEISVDNQKFVMKGTVQLLPVAYSTLYLSRSDVDMLGKFKFGQDKHEIHRIANSVLAASCQGLILGLTLYMVVKNSTCRTKIPSTRNNLRKNRKNEEEEELRLPIRLKNLRT